VKTPIGLPLIGLPCRNDRSVQYDGTPVYAQSVAYARAVTEAGGVPFLIPLNLPLPSLRRLYDIAAGILLAGGGDIDPTTYGATRHATLGDVQRDRDRDELEIARWAMADRRPLMGICRGIQVIAVAAGGSLIQDIPSQVLSGIQHAQPRAAKPARPDSETVHSISLTPSSRLAEIVGTSTILVNSHHHQAVRSVPSAFRVVACSSDGVVEAIEHQEHPFLIGVQWHPELMVASDESAARIFSAFVQACHGRSSMR